MKTKLTVLAIACACCFAGTNWHRREVVILHSCETNGGIPVYASSSSTGAPKFPQYNYQFPNPNKLVESSEALAQLLTEGFTIQATSDNNMVFVLVK